MSARGEPSSGTSSVRITPTAWTPTVAPRVAHANREVSAAGHAGSHPRRGRDARRLVLRRQLPGPDPPAGAAAAALRDLVRAARHEIPRAFESEEYVAGQEAMNELNRRREQLFAGLAARAQALGLTDWPTPVGIAVVPVVGSRPSRTRSWPVCPPKCCAIARAATRPASGFSPDAAPGRAG